MPIFSHFTEFTQAADAVLDYQCDWEFWLTPGDSLASSSWTVSSTDITASNESFTVTAATVWLSGGVLGRTYEITNHITTRGGDQEDKTFVLQIVQE